MRKVIFETPRLLCVDADLSFVDQLTTLFNEASNNAQVGFEVYTPESTAAVVEDMIANSLVIPRFGFQMVALRKSDEGFVGFASAKKTEDDQYPDIGIMLDADARGQGYAVEIIKGLIKLSFNHFGSQIVSGTCTPENVRSIKMLERSGFHQVEHLEKDYFNGREFEDTLVYHIRWEDWAFKAA